MSRTFSKKIQNKPQPTIVAKLDLEEPIIPLEALCEEIAIAYIQQAIKKTKN